MSSILIVRLRNSSRIECVTFQMTLPPTSQELLAHRYVAAPVVRNLSALVLSFDRGNVYVFQLVEVLSAVLYYNVTCVLAL